MASMDHRSPKPSNIGPMKSKKEVLKRDNCVLILASLIQKLPSHPSSDILVGSNVHI